ncbi:MAG TPA: TolC family protein [Bacillota bacterium]|nr:TolC family protein [Bacillota bacterium]HPL52965.1 TolC family protein [Bacillota bacterium]
MKKTRYIICTIICLALLFNGTAASEPTESGILTLNEAKELALKNNMQLKLQQIYIQQASDNYDKVYENNKRTSKGDYTDAAERAAADVARKISIENAASNLRKAIFNRNDLKRASDYNVTIAYYNILKSIYSLEDQKRNVELKEKTLDAAEMKYRFDLTDKNSLTQAEDSLEAAKASYDKSLSDVKDNMAALSKLIKRDLDFYSDKMDMNIILPNINDLDLGAIKKDNIINNPSFFTAKEQYDVAEYKLELTEEKYDHYRGLPNRASEIMEKFEDILYEAQWNFDEIKYNYDEKEKELVISLNNQFSSINSMQESYKSQKKKIEEGESSLQKDKIKFQMGLITNSVLEQNQSSLENLKNQLNIININMNIQYTSITQYSPLQ